MRTLLLMLYLAFLCLPLPLSAVFAAEPIIVDHTCTDITRIPGTWIDGAKANLHIAYGHTSHGSQVTSGMTGLVTFTGGVGGPQFAWNNGGTGGALDLHDYAMGGDCGYYPQWVNNTRTYLDNPSNSDVNVIIWSWCGQVSGYTEQNMIDYYLAPMTQLETDYPLVTFVYMTGHVNYWSKVNTDARNQQIRDYCIDNNKVLFDFADIECWDPDKVFYEYVNDNCDYYNAGGTKLGNWAQEWQNAHVQGVDWYSCSSAHSEPLNANQKAYCVWWLWAQIAGWEGNTLSAHHYTLSEAAGGTVDFYVDADPSKAGRGYYLLGTASGSIPGFTLPGGTHLPLNWDALTDLIVVMLNSPTCSNFAGTLDGDGHATAILNSGGPLPPGFLGLTLNFAYFLDYPFEMASNPVGVVIVP